MDLFDVRMKHSTERLADNEKTSGWHRNILKPACLPITIIIIFIAMVIMFSLLNEDYVEGFATWKEEQQLCLQQDCRAHLVESIPEGMTYPATEKMHLSTYEVWLELLQSTQVSLHATAFYWTLRAKDMLTDDSDAQGTEIYNTLERVGRERQVLLVQNLGTESTMQESVLLQRQGLAEVRSMNHTAWFGSGVMHTKMWIVDDAHLYIGSANMDWRALTQDKVPKRFCIPSQPFIVQFTPLESFIESSSEVSFKKRFLGNEVKEMGFALFNCSCLARDLDKIFQVYWHMGYPGTVLPKVWPPKYTTFFNFSNPARLRLNGVPSEVYFSSSPKQFCSRNRQSDISALLEVINSAKRFVNVAVMDYMPVVYYAKPSRYWGDIDDALRAAAYDRKVSVKLLISKWNHTKLMMFGFLHSLSAFGASLGPDMVQIKLFTIPSYTERQAKIPFSRVNHNKYVVTENTAYIGTSNFVGDYFLTTAGAAVVIRQPMELIHGNRTQDSIVVQLQDRILTTLKILITLHQNVDQWTYITPKYSSWQFNPPEFLKVFTDLRATFGASVTLDCLLIGRPRPKVTWLFNDKPVEFEDVDIFDTADSCRLVIRRLCHHHIGQYAVIAENEVGRATCTASIKFNDGRELSIVLACENHSFKLLCGKHLVAEIEISAAPNILYLTLMKEESQELSEERLLVYGTFAGSIGEIAVDSSHIENKWELPSPNGNAVVNAIECHDLKGDGSLSLLAGRDDGIIEIYHYIIGQGITLIDCVKCPGNVVALQCGYFTTTTKQDILACTYSGKLLAWTMDEPFASSEKDESAGVLEAKFGSLRAEIDKLREEVKSKRAEYVMANQQKAAMSRLPIFPIEERLFLNDQDTVHQLSMELPVSIDWVLLRSEVAIDLLDAKQNSAIFSPIASEGISSDALMATYRCQANMTRFEMSMRTIEGKYGNLELYVCPRTSPTVCQLRAYPIKALSLHRRTLKFDESRPQNKLSVKGKFGLFEAYDIITFCLPGMAEQPPETEEISCCFVSCFTGTQLQISCRQNEITALSDNLSTITILQDVINREASNRGWKLDISCGNLL
ncbi:phospholipase D domain protein [Trichuris suis]|nr:phospholipase D domain protein [Trichuris suis]